MTADTRLLFGTRILRLFAYGFLSVILALYLDAAGLSKVQIGLLLTLTLVGDTAVSLWMTTTADRAGRRRMLLAGGFLMLFAAVVFASTRNFALLLIAATVGVISPSGNEVGPFLSIEQAALSQTVEDRGRTRVFAWYNLVGSFATALGSLCGGALTHLLHGSGVSLLASYRVVVICYGVIGLLLNLLFARMSPAVEAAPGKSAGVATRFGLHKSKGIVARLSGLFAIDAFAGGFMMQSILAYWFHLRFGVAPALLGSIFFGANILAGVSALAAARLAARFGLIRTMVFTHIPSNVLLMLVPLMPTLPLTIVVLLARFSISQMDVPTRQSYMMAVVDPDERSAAAGISGVARSVGASISPVIAGKLLATISLFNALFFVSGGLKIVYDLLLYRTAKSQSSLNNS